MAKLQIDSAEMRNGKLIISAPVWQLAKLTFKPGLYDIRPYKEKRSLNANAYCWKLCGMIAEVLRCTDEEIYRNAIKAVGIYKDIELRPRDEKTFISAWSMLGIGWPVERLDFSSDGDHVLVRCWYGSSTYNSKQMARLIDYIVQDARNMGIETYDDERLTSIIKEWNANGK